MSEQHPNGEFDDELRQRLSALDSDAQGARMPGAAAARKRAARRTRNQIATAVVGGVAVVAAVSLGIVRPVVWSAPEPAETPSESVTAAPTPDETASPTETVLPLPPEALLTADLIRADSIDWQPTDADAVAQCAGSPTITMTRAGTANFTGGPTTHLSQLLAEVEPGTAAAVFTQAREQIRGCVPHGNSDTRTLPRAMEEFTVDGVGDEAWGFRYFAEPTQGEAATIVVVGLARYQDLLTFTVRTSMGQDANDVPDYVTPANAMAQACQVVYNVDCVAEPTPVGINLDDYPDAGTGTDTGADTGSDTGSEAGTETGTDTGTETGTDTGSDTGTDPGDPTDDPTEPPSTVHELAADPFLTDDELNPIGIRDHFASNPQGTPAPYDQMCLTPNGIGETEAHRHFWNPESEGQADEIVLRFADSDDASNFVLDYTDIAARCPDIAAEHEVLGPDVVRSDESGEALVWTVFEVPEDAGTTFFGVGMARRDNVVVVLTHWAMGDPNWHAYVTPTLEIALDRAIAD